MARAHTRWRYLVASHEATDTLYREMCLAPYLPGGMVVAIFVESATLYYIVYNRLTSFYFITQVVSRFKFLLPLPPRPTPSEEGRHVRSGVSIDPTLYEGQTAPPWWSYLWDCCVGVYGIFCTIPTVESYGAGVFCSRRNGLSS
jgi:hypothetical protein